MNRLASTVRARLVIPVVAAFFASAMVHVGLAAPASQPAPAPEAAALVAFARERDIDLSPLPPLARGAMGQSSTVQTARREEHFLIAAAARRLPATADPEQARAVRDGTVNFVRVTAIGEALTLLVEPQVQRWSIESPELARHIRGYIAEQRVSATIPPQARIEAGIMDNVACAYVRIPTQDGQLQRRVTELDKAEVIASFAKWAVARARESADGRRYRAALDMLLTARLAAPEDASFLGLACRCFAGLERTEDLRATAKLLLAGAGADVATLVEAAQACEAARGESELSLALYTKALEIDASHAESQAGLDRAYEQIVAAAMRPATRPAAAEDPLPKP